VPHALLADLVAALHAGFVVFAVLGGLLVLRWPKAAWAHLPCAAWAALVELFGWGCPLTPLENHFHRLAGEAGYAGGFLAHYLGPLLYPEGLTRGHQVVLGLFVLALNAGIYASFYASVYAGVCAAVGRRFRRPG
jgi:hypothetical protein